MNILQDIGAYLGKIFTIHSHSKHDNVNAIVTALPLNASAGHRVAIKENNKYYISSYIQDTWYKVELREGDTFYCLGDKKEYRLIGNDIQEVTPPVVNDLITGGIDKALSAEMGKRLGEGKADKEDVERIKATNIGAKDFSDKVEITKEEDLNTFPLGWHGLIDTEHAGFFPNNVNNGYAIKLGQYDWRYLWLFAETHPYDDPTLYIGIRRSHNNIYKPEWRKIAFAETTPQLYTGSGVPSASLGKAGDIYIRNYTIGWPYINSETNSVFPNTRGYTIFIHFSDFWRQIPIITPSIPS